MHQNSSSESTFEVNGDVLQSLPRPSSFNIKKQPKVSPSSKIDVLDPHASLFRIFLRLLAWGRGLCYLVVGHFLDSIFGRGSRVHRAKNLRRTLELTGGAMVKLGQQMALRLDLLPAEYCDELSQMLDDIPAFETSKAITRIETHTGKPLGETFQAFDPEPVGSASVSCVYQAVLTSGERVAVKVRRPGIATTFAADVKILSAVLELLELFTVVQQGFTKFFRIELRELLIEELDFRSEIRYQELFREAFKERPEFHVTAPEVWFDLSGETVIVSEFVTGVWLKDLLAAIEHQDQEALKHFQENGISGEVVAKRLLRMSYFSFHESLFFHGDPHPANILIGPGNTITMVDFGACGVQSGRERRLFKELFLLQSREDVGGMVRCVISLMEPLPMIDVNILSKELERIWWKGAYGIKSRHSEWWERTSFRLWLGLLPIVRKYQIPLPLNMIRIIRATLLYDTVAARLYSRINVFEEFQKYYANYAKRARQDIQNSVAQQILCGPDDLLFIRAHEILELGERLVNRTSQLLDQPTFMLQATISKSFFFVTNVARFLRSFFVTTVLMILSLFIFFPTAATKIRHAGSDLFEPGVLDELFASHLGAAILIACWALAITLQASITTRRTLVRFSENDTA